MIKVMQAFVRTGAHDQQVKLVEMPIPEIDENEVLVKVQAFGVGLQERYFIPQNTLFPYVIGTEASGVIIKTGVRVTRFKVEERVILTSVLQLKGGCWAEYVAVPQDALIPLPSKMSFVEGAAIPIAGKTALESMRALNLKSGDTLFIAGASGAIGTLVIQLATAQGIIVIGSASQKNHSYMLSLGAQKAVDYSGPNWAQRLKQWIPEGVTAALAIQPGTVEDSMDLVKDGDTVITVSGDDHVNPKEISLFVKFNITQILKKH